jgi:hypothetical protein
LPLIPLARRSGLAHISACLTFALYAEAINSVREYQRP